MAYPIQAFLYGGYLRQLAEKYERPLPDPRGVASMCVEQGPVRELMGSKRPALFRSTYYDGRPDLDEDVPEDLRAYWEAIQLLPDTHLGFGSMRGRSTRRPPRQKGVDTLIAADMLVGAFEHVFDVALLISGDADYVPVIEEVRRRGVVTVLGSDQDSTSDELRRSVDRWVPAGPQLGDSYFPQLEGERKERWVQRSGKVERVYRND